MTDTASAARKTAVALVTVKADDDDLRLDRWFKRHYPGLGHGALEKLLRTGQVRINGAKVKAGDRVKDGDHVRVPPLDQAAQTALSAGPRRPPPSEKDEELIAILRAGVLYRDADVLVINKPPGLAVQGGSGLDIHLDRLLDGLRFEAEETPRLVHRIDKDTSGCLVLARNVRAASGLTRSFRARDAAKTYWALVVGVPKPAQGKIDLALAKEGPHGHEKMRAMTGEDGESDEAKRAITYYSLVEHAGRRTSWLALRPLTGRTHQLRAHTAFLGTPIVGDGKYGGAEAFLTGGVSRKLHLHARAIDIAHPTPGRGRLSVTAPLPSHMAETWALFGFDPDDDGRPFADLDL